MTIIDFILKCVPVSGKVAASAAVVTGVIGAAAVTTYAYRDDLGIWRNADGSAQGARRAVPGRAAGKPAIREGGPRCWLVPVYADSGYGWTGLPSIPEYAEGLPYTGVAVAGVPITTGLFDEGSSLIEAGYVTPFGFGSTRYGDDNGTVNPVTSKPYRPTTSVDEPWSIFLFAIGVVSVVWLHRRPKR